MANERFLKNRGLKLYQQIKDEYEEILFNIYSRQHYVNRNIKNEVYIALALLEKKLNGDE